ncbi:MAG: hypothetical protein WCK78_15215 [Paludibacter sp.]
MKKNRIAAFFAVIFLLAASIFTGCDNTNNSSYGNNYIYMPQATVSGGVNLNYPVPSGYSTATYNFKIDSVNHIVNVNLGVLASGENAKMGYSVDVSVNNDTTNQIISGGTIANAVLLPSTIYTLPSSVTVPVGQYYTSFYLSINSTELKKMTGKIALLTVQLSNPTNYQLNTLLNKTVVVIDVNALKLP